MRSTYSLLLVVLLAAAIGAFYLLSRGAATLSPSSPPLGPSLPPSNLRVISLAPSITEILFALGAGENIVGDTDFCDYPVEAKTKAKIGTMISPSIERIIALGPNYVIATRSSGNRIETAQALAKAGIQLVAVSDASIADLRGAFLQLGDLLGRKKEALALAADLDGAAKKLTALSPGLTDRTALWIIAREPLYPAGKKTLYDDIMTRMGLKNVADWDGWREYSGEVLRATPPDVIFDTSGGPGGYYAKNFGLTKAEVFELPTDEFSRPGPRLAPALLKLCDDLAARTKWANE
ncbi:MAG: helical backbone metal receptor [Candidatus Brocadiia bacterium]